MAWVLKPVSGTGAKVGRPLWEAPPKSPTSLSPAVNRVDAWPPARSINYCFPWVFDQVRNFLINTVESLVSRQSSTLEADEAWGRAPSDVFHRVSWRGGRGQRCAMGPRLKMFRLAFSSNGAIDGVNQGLGRAGVPDVFHRVSWQGGRGQRCAVEPGLKMFRLVVFAWGRGDWSNRLTLGWAVHRLRPEGICRVTAAGRPGGARRRRGAVPWQAS